MARVLTNPAPGKSITSPFGPRAGDADGHKGIDFAGDDFVIVAAGAGTVVAVADQFAPFTPRGFGYSGAGLFVLIRHDQYGFRTGYAHMRAGSRLVEIGDTVQAGQPIGRSGNTGYSFGAHLHFDLWTGLSGVTTQVDGEQYIDWNYNPTNPTNPEGFLMALTDAQQTELYNNVKWIQEGRYVPGQPYTWDQAINNKVDAVQATVNAIKKDTRARLYYDAGVNGTTPESQSSRAVAACVETGFVYPLNSDPAARPGQVTSLKANYHLVDPDETFKAMTTDRFNNMLEHANGHIRRIAAETKRQIGGGTAPVTTTVQPIGAASPTPAIS
ncbi:MULTISPECIES: M23 family metallopeptidase [unclassified Agrococcus]|uniref:M23 family metallopeptidase n=1 Tax=unclassified Agrococcus TaxID=2615065 RepID=UPI00360E9356